MRFGIPWSPVCLRVELDGGQFEILVLESLNSPIIDIGIRDPAAFRERVFIDSKPVVLGGDEIRPSLNLTGWFAPR